MLANQASDSWALAVLLTETHCQHILKAIGRRQKISQQFSVKTICKPELRAMLSITGKQRPIGLKGFHLLGDNLSTGSVGYLI